MCGHFDLEKLLDYLHNYFVKRVYCGKFEIRDGELAVDFLQDFQYCKIKGSVFNDGVHKYMDGDLTDEVFVGQVWAMAVPPAVIALSHEIGEWMEKYGDSVNSPYQSESFGGYSYTKASGRSNNSGSVSPNYGWQDVFHSRLYPYRKLG